MFINKQKTWFSGPGHYWLYPILSFPSVPIGNPESKLALDSRLMHSGMTC